MIRERTIVDEAKLRFSHMEPIEAVLRFAALTYHSLDASGSAEKIAGAQRMGRGQAVRGLILLKLSREEAEKRAKWIEDGEIGS